MFSYQLHLILIPNSELRIFSQGIVSYGINKFLLISY